MDDKQKKLAEELLFSEKTKPSFVKLLYFGLLDSSKVFPYPRPSLEEKERVDRLTDVLEKFASDSIDADAIDRNASIPDSVIAGLGKLGILSMSIPKEYGGLGISQYGYCRVMEKLAQHCNSTALFVNAHQSVGMKALLLFGTKKQQKKWLPGLATGEKLSAFSLTEPNAGSDANGIEARAVYNPEKKTYTITGEKQWTTNGSIADVLTVMAKTEDDKVTAFVVTPDMPGFKVKDAALEKVGMRGSKTSNLIFDHVEVPEENILGPKGKGLRVCLTVLDYGRTTFGATCTGGAKLLVEKAISHANRRHQFGRPLSSFPLVKKKIAHMSALTYAMDATTYLTAGILDSDEKDIMLEAAILKVFTSEALWKICYDAMQIYGGRSFFTDEPLERIMRDARLNMIGEGANEVLQVFIGVVGMRDVGMQLKESLSNIGKLIKSSFWRLFAPTVPVRSPYIQDEAKRLSTAIRRFGWTIVKLLGKYKEAIIEEQLVLERISDAITALYTTSAVLAKFDANPKRKNLPVVKLYCDEALDCFDQALGTLSKNRDKQIESVSDHVTGCAYGH